MLSSCFRCLKKTPQETYANVRGITKAFFLHNRKIGFSMYRVLHYHSIPGKLAAAVPRTNGTLFGTHQRLTKSTLADASLRQGESERK